MSPCGKQIRRERRKWCRKKISFLKILKWEGEKVKLEEERKSALKNDVLFENKIKV